MFLPVFASTQAERRLSLGFTFSPDVYPLTRTWNVPVLLGAYVLALLGVYTATQLICQVSGTRRLAYKLGWFALASFSLGGTGVVGMTWVRMLAMDIGIPNAFPLLPTLLSAMVTISVTFLILASDLLSHELTRAGWARRIRFSFPLSSEDHSTLNIVSRMTGNTSDDHLHIPLLPITPEDSKDPSPPTSEAAAASSGIRRRAVQGQAMLPPGPLTLSETPDLVVMMNPKPPVVYPFTPTLTPTWQEKLEATDYLGARTARNRQQQQSLVEVPIEPGGNSDTSSRTGSPEPSNLAHIDDLLTQFDAEHPPAHAHRRRQIVARPSYLSPLVRNAYLSLTWRVLVKGTVLGLTVLGMQYNALWTMEMDGFFRWYWPYVLLSAACAISTSTVVVLHMPSEPNAAKQMLVAVIGVAGLSAMHSSCISSGQIFTNRGPPYSSAPSATGLPLLILGMAVMTYALSYAMLAQLITESRNRLAEMKFNKRALSKVIAEKEAFARANRVKSEFIAVASHEIRTPLHAISGYTDLLLHTGLTEEQSMFLEVIRMGCYSIHLITNNVLDFSKLEQNTRESLARPTEVDVRTLALHILHSCASPFKMTEQRLRRVMRDNTRSATPSVETHVDLMLLVDEDVPAVLTLDEVYITRVVMNLISNALKFTEDGFVTVHVAIEYPRQADARPLLAISVRDSGIGIPAESQQTIFLPFRQADNSLTRPHTGAGLGLAISAQLCERMGGTIEVWSAPGIGSEFTVRVPAFADTDDIPAPTGSLAIPKQTIAIAMAVRSAKKFEMYKGHLEKRGFSLEVIDLLHPAQGDQPALARPDKVWIDMECFVLAPWLLPYITRVPGASSSSDVPPAAALVVYDDVGNVAEQHIIEALKESGRVNLFRRPIVLHALLQTLRPNLTLTPPSTGTTPSSSRQESPEGTVRELSPQETHSAPPALQKVPSAEDSTGPPKGLDARTKWDGPAASLLNPHETDMQRAKPRPSESDADATTSPLLITAPIPLPERAHSFKQLPVPVGKFILLVEDNIINQKLGKRLLQNLSYHCDIAENGQVALDLVMADEDKYGLVLMDCQMPVMNGFECTRRIRTLESEGLRRSRLPIIALTANVSAESREECQRAGVDCFLPKPLSLRDLKAVLHQYFPADNG